MATCLVLLEWGLPLAVDFKDVRRHMGNNYLYVVCAPEPTASADPRRSHSRSPTPDPYRYAPVDGREEREWQYCYP